MVSKIIFYQVDILWAVKSRGGRKRKPRWAGAPPGKKILVLSSVENPVRTSWNFSSAPLGIFRLQPLGKKCYQFIFKIFLVNSFSFYGVYVV
ncbi:hypothetical protein HanIR_Chr11g0528441 [Helianthus annuus]|nr:hypothetical protein HanIR_Chr11g0528441 [Helianthus annuus]